jgi:tRNA-2-methylthio-N6-dimethylallyladenosine synthase
VSTDIIVGFPGETEEDFQATLDLFEESRFDQAFLFIFSPRPGTAAAAYESDFVDPEVIQDRFQRLVSLHGELSLASNRNLLGRRLDVLVEGPSKKDPEVMTARTRGGKVVHVGGRYPTGALFDVEITSAAQHHLVGSQL